MEDEAAWIALAIYIVGSYVWYKYCIRIYNRFRVRSVGFAWKDDDEDHRPEARKSDESGQSFSPSEVTHSSAPNFKKHNSLLGRLTRKSHLSAGDLK